HALRPLRAGPCCRGVCREERLAAAARHEGLRLRRNSAALRRLQERQRRLVSGLSRRRLTATAARAANEAVAGRPTTTVVAGDPHDGRNRRPIQRSRKAADRRKWKT